jgi:monoamine oxidase
MHVETAVIGAGAAGIAAGQLLRAHGRDVLVLEARSRIGGRALTRGLIGNICFDVGCEWLHSADRNGLLPVARELGFTTSKAPSSWSEPSIDTNFPLAAQMEFNAACAAFYDRLEVASNLSHDTSAAAWLEPGNPWNPLIDAISSYVNGTELAEVSVYDSEAYLDSGVDLRIREGYGALVAAMACDCPIALASQVQTVDHSGPDIVLQTSRGSLHAERVVCTVPTSLIARESLRFNPPLPDKLSACVGLPLGNAEKVMLGVDVPDMFPENGHVFGATDRTATGSYELRPFGQPCIEGFFGGRLARELEAAGELAGFAVDELVQVFGSNVRRSIHPLAASNWTRDPFAYGSYSYALPGFAGCRTSLACPVNGRIFFAGEATSPDLFSTAHGAYESGLRAAREVLESLKHHPLQTLEPPMQGCAPATNQ